MLVTPVLLGLRHAADPDHLAAVTTLLATIHDHVVAVAALLLLAAFTAVAMAALTTGVGTAL